MQDIIAVKAISYGGKRYNPGDKIPARPRDAKVLMALGKAKPSGPIVAAKVEKTAPTPPPPPSAPPALIKADDTPPPAAPAQTPDATPPAPETAPNTPTATPETSDTPPRRYKRRDITAEG